MKRKFILLSTLCVLLVGCSATDEKSAVQKGYDSVISWLSVDNTTAEETDNSGEKATKEEIPESEQMEAKTEIAEVIKIKKGDQSNLYSDSDSEADSEKSDVKAETDSIEDEYLVDAGHVQVLMNQFGYSKDAAITEVIENSTQDWGSRALDEIMKNEEVISAILEDSDSDKVLEYLTELGFSGSDMEYVCNYFGISK